MKALTFAFVALLVLLAVSVAVAFVPLGAAGWLVGLGIAALKAVVVVGFFMEWKRQRWETKGAAWTGGVWLLFLFSLTLVDYLTR